MANRVADPSISANIRLRNEWETSNRTLKDIEMLLRKIKDDEYILKQCVSNATPNKNILKQEALEYVAVQRELVRIGMEILSCHKHMSDLLEKEENLLKYEIILEAFQDDSQQEIIDWESFSNLTFMEGIHYTNSICLSEGMGIENVLLELKEADLQEYYKHFYDILKVVDPSLINDHFNSLILPQGNDALEGENILKRGDLDLNFDPLPYQIIAKRIFLEELSPNKAYYLLLLGIQRGINCLDYDAVVAFEIAEIFELNKKEKVLSTTSDVKSLINFDNSYDRYKHLIVNDYFLLSYFNCIADIVDHTNDDRIYQNHYLQHLKAYIDEEQDLEFLRSLLNQMCSDYLFMEPVEGCDLVISELYKTQIKNCSQVRELSSLLEEYITAYSVESRNDEARKWQKL